MFFGQSASAGGTAAAAEMRSVRPQLLSGASRVTHPTNIDVKQTPLKGILGMRDAYRRDMNCQIVHDSYHARGFTRSYLLRVQGQVAGYGSIDARGTENTVKEFYLLPPYRATALSLFRALLAATRAHWIEAQTNDLSLAPLLADCAVNLASDTILFAEGRSTGLLPPPGIVLRPVVTEDRSHMFSHTTEPVGEWGLELDRQVVATGGLMFHYNPPYADIYMEVAAPYRRRGYASYLIQELKRLCRAQACIPAARCDAANLGSRLALERAGMVSCARIVRGRVAA